MKIYLAASHVPELAGLSSRQRRFVWRHCVHPFLLRPGVRALALAVSICCAWTGWWLGGFTGFETWGRAIGAGVLVGLGSYFHDLLWASRQRVQIAQFLRDHAAEIQSAA